jgi:glucose-6-phosphate dehydrogenase assembly protein OpcA
VTLDLAPLIEGLAGRHREHGKDVRTATMTIVVFFEDAAIGALARDRIHMLASKHPSRVVVLDAAQDSTLSRVETGDWIEIGVKGRDGATMHSAAQTLRLPEAPVVLLWIACGIGSDPRFAAMLGDEVELIVYNSSLLDDESAALCELAEYVANHPHVHIADIAYLRLSPWQESVAVLFDGSAGQELPDLRSVEITCGSKPEGYYLLGWLASRLRWTPHANGTLTNRRDEPVEYAIRRQGEPRRVARVALRSSRSEFVAEVDDQAETIRLSVTGSSEHPLRYRAVNNPGIAALVERAILWGHNDRIFADSLAAAGNILGCEKS